MNDKYIDLTNFPTYQRGNKTLVKWNEVNKHKAKFKYKNIEGIIEVSFKEKRKGSPIMSIFYENKEYEMNSSNLLKCKLGNVLGKKNTNHKYNIGDVVSNSKVVEQKRVKNNRGENILAYTMLCLVSNKEYEVTQYNLNYGYGSPYVSGHKVWEGNWLFNEKHILRYLVNPEEAKQYTSGCASKILCKCQECGEEQLQPIKNLVKRGFTCSYCRPSMSFPEMVMTSYLKVKNINFIPQKPVRCPNSVRHFDFYLTDFDTVVETHGILHYEEIKSINWRNSHELTKKSDEEKRLYCKNNNITLIEVDCRKSNFNFICTNIEKYFGKITELEKEKMLNIIEDIKYKRRKQVI